MLLVCIESVWIFWYDDLELSLFRKKEKRFIDIEKGWYPNTQGPNIAWLLHPSQMDDIQQVEKLIRNSTSQLCFALIKSVLGVIRKLKVVCHGSILGTRNTVYFRESYFQDWFSYHASCQNPILYPSPTSSKIKKPPHPKTCSNIFFIDNPVHPIFDVHTMIQV